MVTAEAIAREIGNLGDLKRKSKVVAFVDLPGVPEGTPGKVALVNGWETWVRYHVMFANGVNIGSINREALAPAKKYATFVQSRAQAIEAGVFDRVEAAADDGAAAESEDGDGGGGDVTVNGVDVPGHLLERSKNARVRLGAPPA